MPPCHPRGPMKVVDNRTTRNDKKISNNEHYLRPKLDGYNK